MRITIVVALVLIALVATAVVAQQRPAPAPGARGDRMGAPADMEQMLNMVLDRIGLTEAEKAAAKKAARAKMEATNALRQELRALAEAAQKEKATNKELSAALRRFDAALSAHRQKVKAIDAQLVKAISLKARAALTAIGVIDNGMGGRFGRRMREGAAGQPPSGGRGGSGPGARRPQSPR